MYRNVTELPKDCLEYLKFSTYYDDETIQDCAYFWEIPDEVIFEKYNGICFVPEDFYAGAGDNWEVQS